MSGKKVQGQVTDYHDFVIEQLIGLEGTSRSDVVSRIIGWWIRDNEERLGRLGIAPEVWRAHRAGAIDPKVVSYTQGTGRQRFGGGNE